jgi:hypothetical protein
MNKPILSLSKLALLYVSQQNAVVMTFAGTLMSKFSSRAQDLMYTVVHLLGFFLTIQT